MFESFPTALSALRSLAGMAVLIWVVVELLKKVALPTAPDGSPDTRWATLFGLAIGFVFAVAGCYISYLYDRPIGGALGELILSWVLFWLGGAAVATLGHEFVDNALGLLGYGSRATG